MWKVRKISSRNSVILGLSGRLEGKHLAELQKAFLAEVPEARDENLVLDLKEVRLVDRDAVSFLAHCQASGARLLNCPGYIREWIAREQDA